MGKFSRTAASAVLAIGGLASLTAELPGTMLYDSYIQLLEGRTGHYSFWHPPVMSWLLGVTDAVLPGSAFFVTLQTLIGFGALIAILWTARRVSLLAVFACLIFAFLPQLLMFQGYVLKDVFFADTILAGFAALALAARYWLTLDARAGWLLVSAIFLVVAILARQNGILFLPLAVVALYFIIRGYGGRIKYALIGGLSFGVVIGLGVFAADVSFGMFHGGEAASTDQFKVLRIYDLAAMRHHDPALRFDLLAQKAPKLERALVKAQHLYTPEWNDPLSSDPAVNTALGATKADIIAQQWENSVKSHPGLWLKSRAEIFAWMFLPAHRKLCRPFYVGANGAGADGDPGYMGQLGMKARYDQRDEALKNYGLNSMQAFNHALFGLISLLALIALLWRHRPEDFALAGLNAGALLFTASFYAISIACDYRYLYALDLAALASLIYLAADPAMPKPNFKRRKPKAPVYEDDGTHTVLPFRRPQDGPQGGPQGGSRTQKP